MDATPRPVPTADAATDRPTLTFRTPSKNERARHQKAFAARTAKEKARWDRDRRAVSRALDGVPADASRAYIEAALVDVTFKSKAFQARVQERLETWGSEA